MRLRLNDDEELIATTARRILERVAAAEVAAQWGEKWIDGPYRALGETGMLELGLRPVDSDADLAAQSVVVAHELGRHAYVSPFFVSMGWCGSLLGLLGKDVAGLASGATVYTLAAQENREFLTGLHRPETHITRGPKEMRLQGKKRFVQFADVADSFLVTAQDEREVVLVAVPRSAAGSIGMNKLSSVSGDMLFDVTFDIELPADAIVGRGNALAAAFDKTLAHVLMLQSAFLVGGAERALEIVTEHVIHREQFGQAVGSFQAVQHHLANSRSSVDAGRLMVYELAWRTGKDDSLQLAHAAETKAWIAETSAEVIRRAHELQGGISVVDMHETIWHFRRNLAESVQFCSTAELWPLAYPLCNLGPGVQELGAAQ